MKFYVKDEDGQKFEVEEVEEMNPAPETKDEEPASLTDDEIAALKGLAARAGEIIKLLGVEREEHEAMGEGDEVEEGEEIVVDTDEETEEVLKKAHDSKKSFGSVQKRPVVADSVDDADEINNIWAKRFGGMN